jgi:uncharacterized protein (UPF0276 family)
MLDSRCDGVAVGWRPELGADLLRAPETVDFVEVVAESCFAQAAQRREACATAEIWPVVVHGVKLSLGSASGFELGRVARLGALARELRSPAISEHVAMTRGGGRDIGHLTPLPWTHEAVTVVARNVAAARRVLPDVPLLLENIAWTLRWPEDAMGEAEFYQEIVAATGCELLLDVANLYANAVNAGLDPERLLDAFPLDRVAMVHVAGGVVEGDFYQDTHADGVPEPVFALLAQLFARTGPLPVILERDAAFPPFAELLAELGRIRELSKSAPRVARAVRAPRARAVVRRASGGLSERQAALAALLTDVAAPDPLAAGGFDLASLWRTRAVLQHKRVDEALPLLARLAAEGDAARTAAFAALRGAARAPTGTGIVDALRVADASSLDPRLEAAARRDRLELRSRFVASASGGARPRNGPFLGRESLPDGRSVWALKGLGAEARVRFLELGGER